MSQEIKNVTTQQLIQVVFSLLISTTRLLAKSPIPLKIIRGFECQTSREEKSSRKYKLHHKKEEMQ